MPAESESGSAPREERPPIARLEDHPAPQAASRGAGPLPSGRHQLSAKLVKDHQYQRLISAITALSAEQGYATVVISEIVARAAVSKSTFYRFFETKQQCLLAAHKHYSAALLAAIDAKCDPRNPWPEQLRCATRTALQFCAKRPDAAQLLTMGVLSCGPEGAARYRTTIEAIATRFRSGSPRADFDRTALTLTAGFFSAPTIAASASSDPAALRSLEDEFVEVILALADL